jgi:hypothetical protein
MTEKSLEAMLRRACRMAETKFRRDGEVTVLWLLTPDGPTRGTCGRSWS